MRRLVSMLACQYRSVLISACRSLARDQRNLIYQMADSNGSRPRLLISNDDGINASGLRALANAILKENFCTFSESAPAGERSAQSHSISVGKHLHAFEIPVAGAEEAFAVDGTPADSVMIALNGPLLKNPAFDLVVSGINRGDNCGLHVVYSGTVGAAREAACKNIPAIAMSLDNYQARTEEAYHAAAIYCVAIIKAVLGLLPGLPRQYFTSTFCGSVINVNLPRSEASAIKGYYLAHQGEHCHFPDFTELEADQHALDAHAHMGAVTLRAFRNKAGFLRPDHRKGTDSWAVANGWVAVTPIGLQQDVPLSIKAAAARHDEKLVAAVAAAMAAAAKALGAAVGGTEGLRQLTEED